MKGVRAGGQRSLLGKLVTRPWLPARAGPSQPSVGLPSAPQRPASAG